MKEGNKEVEALKMATIGRLIIAVRGIILTEPIDVLLVSLLFDAGLHNVMTFFNYRTRNGSDAEFWALSKKWRIFTFE
jgi:hypothetical protein